ncbi:hypothetical protein DL769_004036 [Monosporascus sp. CRB-8-3]|nr:hypothetical protein DL769_004036 [Monosporascus sp. CRB-8-3]
MPNLPPSCGRSGGPRSRSVFVAAAPPSRPSPALRTSARQKRSARCSAVPVGVDGDGPGGFSDSAAQSPPVVRRVEDWRDVDDAVEWARLDAQQRIVAVDGCGDGLQEPLRESALPIERAQVVEGALVQPPPQTRHLLHRRERQAAPKRRAVSRIVLTTAAVDSPSSCPSHHSVLSVFPRIRRRAVARRLRSSAARPTSESPHSLRGFSPRWNVRWADTSCRLERAKIGLLLATVVRIPRWMPTDADSDGVTGNLAAGV